MTEPQETPPLQVPSHAAAWPSPYRCHPEAFDGLAGVVYDVLDEQHSHRYLVKLANGRCTDCGAAVGMRHDADCPNYPQPDAAPGETHQCLFRWTEPNRIECECGVWLEMLSTQPPAPPSAPAQPDAAGETTTCEGWICEAHPHRHWPHDACAGPGMPCAHGPYGEDPPSAPAQRVPHSDSNQSDLTYMLPPSAPASAPDAGADQCLVRLNAKLNEAVRSGSNDILVARADLARVLGLAVALLLADAAQRQHAAEFAEKDAKFQSLVEDTVWIQNRRREAEAALKAAQQEGARLREAIKHIGWMAEGHNASRWQIEIACQDALAATPPAATPAEQEAK